MPSPESRGGALNTYKEFNRTTRNIALGVAVVGAFAAPALISPALLWAASDQVQIAAIDRWQNRKKENT